MVMANSAAALNTTPDGYVAPCRGREDHALQVIPRGIHNVRHTDGAAVTVTEDLTSGDQAAKWETCFRRGNART